MAIDGRAAGWEALRWAAVEASARGCRLRIVHVFRWPPFARDAYGYVLVHEWYPDAYEAAQALLDAAKDRALQISPTLQVTTQLEAGPVVANVLRSRDREALLVIGRHPPVGRLTPAPWSVSWQLARRSAAPVVMVGAIRESSAAAPSAGRVVVVLDDLEGAFDAVTFALSTARRWGVGLTALVAGATEAAKAVRDWSKACPDVHLRERVVAGRDRLALAEESRGAALVVVGGHRHGRLHSAFVGSVDGEVTREAAGPIAFVRADPHRSVPRHSALRGPT